METTPTAGRTYEVLLLLICVELCLVCLIRTTSLCTTAFSYGTYRGSANKNYCVLAPRGLTVRILNAIPEFFIIAQKDQNFKFPPKTPFLDFSFMNSIITFVYARSEENAGWRNVARQYKPVIYQSYG